MRNVKPTRAIISIVAGLVGLGATALPARSQYVVYPPYVPYYAYPYGYYPPPYYPPPPVVYMPGPYARPPVVYAPRAYRRVHRQARRASVHRRAPRGLINPLLGPLPSGPLGRR